MRPRRTVLLVCPNEVTASVFAFNLDVWGFRATSLHDVDEAVELLRSREFDLALLLPGTRAAEAEWFARRAIEIDALQRERDGRTLLYDSEGLLTADAAQGVSRLFAPVKCAEAVREAVRVALARRRGPKKVRARELGPAFQVGVVTAPFKIRDESEATA